jgi:ADP-ribose pyrophosphatase YjhB (NUDIX family)
MSNKHKHKGTPVKMKFSAGGLIYRNNNGKFEVALIMHRNLRGEEVWSIPKGLIEKGEKVERTAFREVKEETGLIGEVKEKLGEIEYWYYSREDNARIHKKVYLFLLAYLEGSTENHDAEVEDVRWWTLEEAEKILSYPSEKRILQQAKLLLIKKQE